MRGVALFLRSGSGSAFDDRYPDADMPHHVKVRITQEHLMVPWGTRSSLARRSLVPSAMPSFNHHVDEWHKCRHSEVVGRKETEKRAFKASDQEKDGQAGGSNDNCAENACVHVDRCDCPNPLPAVDQERRDNSPAAQLQYQANNRERRNGVRFQRLIQEATRYVHWNEKQRVQSGQQRNRDEEDYRFNEQQLLRRALFHAVIFSQLHR